MLVTASNPLKNFFNSKIANYFRAKTLDKVANDQGTKDRVNKYNLVDYSLQQIIARKTDEVLAPNRFSVLRNLSKVAKESPTKAIFSGNYANNNTAEKVFSNVKRLAYSLKQLGLKPGDKVALMALPHEKELYESFCAIQAIGAVPVLINFLNPSPVIAYMFVASKAKTLIVGRDYRLRAGANKLAFAGLLERVIAIGRTEYSKETNNIKNLFNTSFYNPLFYTYESLVKQPEIKEEELLLDPKEKAPALQLFTSGTESKPKRITYTYEMVASVMEHASKRFNITENDAMLFPVPFYHLAGLIVFSAVFNYYCPMILTEIPRASEPETVHKALNNIIKNKVTIFPGVPKIIEPVLEEAVNKNLLLESLHTIFSGAAPLTPKLLGLVEKINEKRKEKKIDPIKLINFYASTECGPISSTVEPPIIEAMDILGIPFENVEVKLSNDETNELLVKAPVFPPDLPQETLTQDGFFKTGDQVAIDAKGNLFYLDRLSDRLNVNGEKISPLIIQRELEKIDGIKEAHVFGVTNPEKGTDIVSAIVATKDGYEINIDKVKKILGKRLSKELRAFIPRVILVKPEGVAIELLRGPGKIPRRLLKKFYGDEVIREYKRIKAMG